ncbi:MAG: hypothetical protein WCP60_09850 [bacterium]
MMKPVLFLLCILQIFAGYLQADEQQLIQAALANQQLSILNRLTAMHRPPEPTNRLQTISLNEIMTAIDQGATGKEIYERAKMTNDPRIPQLNLLGGYRVHPNVTAYLSPMNSNTIEAKTAPTPESAEDARLRMENEARMRAAEQPHSQAVHQVDERKEMQQIYEQAEKLQAKVRAKVLKELP